MRRRFVIPIIAVFTFISSTTAIGGEEAPGTERATLPCCCAEEESPICTLVLLDRHVLDLEREAFEVQKQIQDSRIDLETRKKTLALYDDAITAEGVVIDTLPVATQSELIELQSTIDALERNIDSLKRRERGIESTLSKRRKLRDSVEKSVAADTPN